MVVCKLCNQETNDFRKNRRICRNCEREISRQRTFKWIRGISCEERDGLLEKQGGVCAACGTESPGSSKGWHVDHSHRTDLVRGILCATCNVALGQVNDSVVRLQKLIDYLRKSNDYLERE